MNEPAAPDQPDSNQKNQWQRVRELVGKLQAMPIAEREAHLHYLRDNGENKDVLTLLELELRLGPEQVSRITPELREWARQQFTDEEIVAGLHELREKGALDLREFLDELEQIVAESERTLIV